MHETLLLFGATGDLAQRYLFQSLLNLLRDRLLPPGFRVYAIARQDIGSDGLRSLLGERLAKSGAPTADINELLSRCEYLNVDLSDPQLVAERLEFLRGRDCVSYLSTPPGLYVPITQGLKAAGLLDAPSRLVLEKPIGRDLTSARDIMAAVGECVSEDRVFRIDHYLGKAPVQNLMALRFGNALLEAVWHHRWIASVDIMVAETDGVDGRESYYANYGALRDMVQNHILQLLCLIAMEPPSALDADSVRNEKLKVLRALRPMSAERVNHDSVRGVYQAGVVAGKPVAGFKAPTPEADDCETYVALVAHIDNWRWAGVPFRLRTGKRMADRCSEVVITFREPSHWIFEQPTRENSTPNRLVFRLQPEENIELTLMSSLAAPEWGALELQPLPLDLSMPINLRRRIAYERLLLDAFHGNPALFVRNDEVEAAWTWIDSVADAWKQAGTPLQPYMAGSWGPEAALSIAPEGSIGGRRRGRNGGGG